MGATLLSHALLWGAILSLYLTVAFIALARINPEMWLNDYPPDIRQAFGPMSAMANRQRWFLGLPVMIIALGFVILATIQFVGASQDPSFMSVFLHTFIMLMVFNVVDLVLIDWLLFVRLQPRFIVLPGTEDLAGYRDYAFHWRAFLKGTAGILVVSVLVAGIVAAPDIVAEGGGEFPKALLGQLFALSACPADVMPMKKPA